MPNDQRDGGDFSSDDSAAATANDAMKSSRTKALRKNCAK